MPPTEQDARLTVPVSEADHVRGPATALVTLVEYGEFECPHCGRAFHVINELREEFGDELRFVFRHYPLDSEHPFSLRASLAAEAAAAQGKFWAMHDHLFTHQHSLSYDDLRIHAETLGLDGDRLEADIRAGAYLARIKDDFESGTHSGVRETPTFFINEVKGHGLLEAGSLRAAVEAEIASARSAARSA